jgi:hypothetical protein
MARHPTINEMLKTFESMDKVEFDKTMRDSLTAHGQKIFDELHKKEGQEQQLYDQLNNLSRNSYMLYEKPNTPIEEIRAYEDKRMFYLGQIKLVQSQIRSLQNQLPSCIKFDFDVNSSDPIVLD